jgi:hypothetical protein
MAVAPDGIRSDDDLDGWIERGVAFPRGVPAKG